VWKGFFGWIDEAERADVDRHWRQRIERAAYEAGLTRRQYAAVDPDNRLVARTLERQWEEALTEQARLEAEYQRHQREQPKALSRDEISRIRDQASRTVEVFSVDDALDDTEWQPYIKTIVRVTRYTLLRSAATGLWNNRGEIAYYVSSVSFNETSNPT
jgi:hypothetical protein